MKQMGANEIRQMVWIGICMYVCLCSMYACFVCTLCIWLIKNGDFHREQTKILFLFAMCNASKNKGEKFPNDSLKSLLYKYM